MAKHNTADNHPSLLRVEGSAQYAGIEDEEDLVANEEICREQRERKPLRNFKLRDPPANSGNPTGQPGTCEGNFVRQIQKKRSARSFLSSRDELSMKFGLIMIKSFFRVVWVLALAAVFLTQSSCSRLRPVKTESSSSSQMVLDTRRAPVVQLSGCFIPAVFPAVTKVPVMMIQKIPPTAVFKTATVEVVVKNGEMALLEAVIENNQVYLNFAVPSVDSFTQYNVVVRATYEYR